MTFGDRKGRLARRTGLDSRSSLARSPAPQRRTPLGTTGFLRKALDDEMERGRGALGRSAPLARTPFLLPAVEAEIRERAAEVTEAAKRARVARRSDGSFTTRTRALMYDRDDRRCVRCGRSIKGLRWSGSVQHRRARGAGGTSLEWVASPANGVASCGSGTTDCHGWMEGHPDEAEAVGWRIPLSSRSMPWEVPVLYAALGQVWLLDQLGGHQVVEVLAPGQSWDLVRGVHWGPRPVPSPAE